MGDRDLNIKTAPLIKETARLTQSLQWRSPDYSAQSISPRLRKTTLLKSGLQMFHLLHGQYGCLGRVLFERFLEKLSNSLKK
jgi:hypothetical protein